MGQWALFVLRALSIVNNPVRKHGEVGTVCTESPQYSKQPSKEAWGNGRALFVLRALSIVNSPVRKHGAMGVRCLY